MGVLILVEHDNQVMLPSTRNVLFAALQLGDEPILLVAGHECQAVADEACALSGVRSVWLADHVCYAHQLAEPVSQLIKELSGSFSHIITASSTFGKNILPRSAAMLDVTQLSDVTRIIDHNTFEHPIYAGNAIETVEMLDNKKLLTIRTTAFDAVVNKQEPCGIERIAHVFTQTKTSFMNHQLNASVRPDLTSADIIVSGGRGLQNSEKFKLVEELADVLGAAVGASRAAVDAGFVPNDYQVGQTGKIVAPKLYIAIGISGAVQHMAGMKDSHVIVAINKDGDAPIFQIANYGLVGDLFDLVPKLISELKSRGLSKC
ncbi:MAG: FAD-binding protein [Legionellaceae bacterium]|nr:FAD-binding protein [Legionellaceae bacterium]